MKDSPILTVVTPTYNLLRADRVATFRQCVESVQNQTYTHIEHLVIDGGSTDGTVKILKQYAELGWISYISEPDKGLYNAMNKGIAMAKGKYIAFLNSDDYWHAPNGIEKTIEFLERAQADFSYAPHNRIRGEKLLGEECPMMSIFYRGMPFCHQTMIISTEKVRECGGFDEQFRVSADFDLITNLILRGAKPVYVPYNFTTYRTDGFSGQADNWQELLSDKRAILQRYYGSIIGEDGVEKLMKDEVNPELFDVLESLVHPAIASNLRSSVRNNNGRFVVCKRRYFKGKESGIIEVKKKAPVAPVPAAPSKTVRRINGILGLPLMKIVAETNGRTGYYLFHILPIYQTRRKEKDKKGYISVTHKLLFALPVMKVLTRTPDAEKYRLFGIIPLYSEKRS